MQKPIVTYWPTFPTGTVASVERDLQKAVKYLDTIMKPMHGRAFKIGITGDPEKRAQQHDNYTLVDTWDDPERPNRQFRVYEKGLWDAMHVIFQTPSSSVVRQAEAAAIRYVAEVHRIFDVAQKYEGWNKVGGGGGNLRPVGPYFVYVLRGGPVHALV